MNKSGVHETKTLGSSFAETSVTSLCSWYFLLHLPPPSPHVSPSFIYFVLTVTHASFSLYILCLFYFFPKPERGPTIIFIDPINQGIGTLILENARSFCLESSCKIPKYQRFISRVINSWGPWGKSLSLIFFSVEFDLSELATTKVVLVLCKVIEFSSIWGRHWWLAFYCTVNSRQIGTRHHLLDKRNIVFKGKQPILTRASIENIVCMSLPFISLGWSCTLCTVVANELLKWKKKRWIRKAFYLLLKNHQSLHFYFGN